MSRVVHFEIPADDPQASMEFYSKVFGWTYHKWDGPQDYWMVLTGEGEGINGGLMPKNEGQPVTCTIDSDDIDADTKKIEEAGGQIVVPKMAIPGIGWLIYFTDPSGNIFGVMQNDESAA